MNSGSDICGWLAGVTYSVLLLKACLLDHVRKDVVLVLKKFRERKCKINVSHLENGQDHMSRLKQTPCNNFIDVCHVSHLCISMYDFSKQLVLKSVCIP